MLLQSTGNIVYPQWIAGMGVTLLIIEIGCLGGWVSPTLARLTMLESPIPLDPEQASWVASLINISRLVGSIFGAIAVNLLGSKRTMFVTIFPMALGWLFIAVANNVEWLYIARLSSGLGLGMAFNTFPLYIGEVSMPEIRGALIALATCGGPFGQIIASICSSYLDMMEASLIYLSICIVLMVIFFYLPESPHHLMKINDREAAKASINWYRAGRGVDTELDAVEKFVGERETFINTLKEFKIASIRHATYQIIALYTFMQICGLNSVIFYMEIILTRAHFNLVKPSHIVIYVNICGTLASAISILMIDRYGRRFLLLISSSGLTIAMLGLMSYFLMLDLKVETSNLQWIPMSSMFIFIISFFIGLMPVPSTILSEIFPANVKCIAACIAGLSGAIMAFASAKTYQPMVNLMGETYVFLIYAICSVIIIPYALCIMPETKGKCLQQIQEELIRK